MVGHDIHLEVKVGERSEIAHVKQMGSLCASHECAIFDLPGIRVINRTLPAVECGSVAEQGEPGFDFSRCEPGNRGQERADCNAEQ